MAQTGFRPSRDLNRQLRKDRKFVRGLERHADEVLAAARELAPVDSGDYRDSLHVETRNGRVRVVADDYKAFWIEYGTGEPGQTKAYRVLRRAARKAGLRFRGRRKKAT